MEKLTKIIVPMGTNSQDVVAACKSAGIENVIVLKSLYEGSYGGYDWSNGQLLIQIRKLFLKNGTELLYQGDWDSFAWSKGQLLIEFKKKLYLVEA